MSEQKAKRVKLNNIHRNTAFAPEDHATLDSKEDWVKARKIVLVEEKELSRAYDAVVQTRRNMPWLKVKSDYKFNTDGGEKILSDLFGDKDNLIIQHLMYNKDDSECCSICAYFSDGYSGQFAHINANNTSFFATSPAPLDKLNELKSMKKWEFPMASCTSKDFNVEFGVEGNAEQKAAKDASFYNFGSGWFPCSLYPGLSVFYKRGDNVYLTYQAQSRGLDVTNGANHLFDFLPNGRNGFNAGHKEKYAPSSSTSTSSSSCCSSNSSSSDNTKKTDANCCSNDDKDSKCCKKE